MATSLGFEAMDLLGILEVSSAEAEYLLLILLLLLLATDPPETSFVRFTGILCALCNSDGAFVVLAELSFTNVEASGKDETGAAGVDSVVVGGLAEAAPTPLAVVVLAAALYEPLEEADTVSDMLLDHVAVRGILPFVDEVPLLLLLLFAPLGILSWMNTGGGSTGSPTGLFPVPLGPPLPVTMD